MTLRSRFTFWFGLASLVPIAAAALITRQVVLKNRRDGFERKLAQAGDEARREVARLLAEVEKAVGELSATNLIGSVLVELRKGDGELSSMAARELKQSAPSQMRLADLDLLVEHRTALVQRAQTLGLEGDVQTGQRIG